MSHSLQANQAETSKASSSQGFETDSNGHDSALHLHFILCARLQSCEPRLERHLIPISKWSQWSGVSFKFHILYKYRPSKSRNEFSRHIPAPHDCHRTLQARPVHMFRAHPLWHSLPPPQHCTVRHCKLLSSLSSQDLWPPCSEQHQELWSGAWGLF